MIVHLPFRASRRIRGLDAQLRGATDSVPYRTR